MIDKVQHFLPFRLNQLIISINKLYYINKFIFLYNFQIFYFEHLGSFNLLFVAQKVVDFNFYQILAGFSV